MDKPILSAESNQLKMQAKFAWLAISMLVGALTGVGIGAWFMRGRTVLERPDALLWNGTVLKIGSDDELLRWPENWPGHIVNLERDPDDPSETGSYVEFDSDELLIQLKAADLYPFGKLKLASRKGQFMELSCHGALTEPIESPDDVVKFLLQLSPTDSYRDSISFVGPVRYKARFFGIASNSLRGMGFDVSAEALIELCDREQQCHAQK